VAIKHPALVERAALSPSYYLPSSILLQLNRIKNQSGTSHANPRHNLLALALLFVPSINDYTAFPKSQNNLKLTSTKRVRQTKSKPLGHLTKPHTDATFPSKHTLPTQLVPVKKKPRTIDGGPLFSRNLSGSRRARLRGRDAGRDTAGLTKFLR